MTQVGTRCEVGEEGAWQRLGWTRGKPGCTALFENPANLLKSFRLRENLEATRESGERNLIRTGMNK